MKKTKITSLLLVVIMIISCLINENGVRIEASNANQLDKYEFRFANPTPNQILAKSYVEDGEKKTGYDRLQNFCFKNNKRQDGGVIYGTIRLNADDDNKKDDLCIVKYKLDEKNNVAKYDYQYMTILNGGHGETLDIYEYNGIDYLIVAVGSNDNSVDGVEFYQKYYFARSIAIIRFENSNGNKDNIKDATECARIRYLAKAFSETKDWAVLRANACVGNNNDLTVRTLSYNKNKNNKQFDYSYVTYKIDNIIKDYIYKNGNEDYSKAINTANLQDSKKYLISHYHKNVGSDINAGESNAVGIFYIDTFQGMETYNKELHMSSGKENMLKNLCVNKFAKYYPNNKISRNFVKPFTYTHIDANNNKHIIKSSECEIQGISYTSKGNMFILFEKGVKVKDKWETAYFVKLNCLN